MRKLILVLLLILFGTLVFAFAQSNIIENKNKDLNSTERLWTIVENNGFPGIVFGIFFIIYLIELKTNIIKKLMRAMPKESTGDNPHVSLVTYNKLIDSIEDRRDKMDIRFDDITKKLGYQKSEIDNSIHNIENLQN